MNMDADNLLKHIEEKYTKLSSITSHLDLKTECKVFFDDICLDDICDKISEFINNVKNSIQMTSSDISDKYEEQSDLIKVMKSQVAFFLAFYSFLVSKHSLEIDESMKDEISSWLVDILSNLNICMGNSDWKVFMANFVISFHTSLAPVLLEVYECMGLDIPSEIEPANYNIEDDINFSIDFPAVARRKKKKVQTVNLDESLASLKSKESSTYRPALDLDRPFATLSDVKQTLPVILQTRQISRTKSSVGRLETSRPKSSNKKVTKESTPKKTRKRRSFVPETPNKSDYIPRPLRAAVAAAKKLNGKKVIEMRSPIPDRSLISTPTTQSRIRRAKSISMKLMKERSGPTNEADLWVKRMQDERRSLTNYSSDSFDLQRTTSMSSLDNSTNRVTRFRARLFDSFMSPVKDTNSGPITAKPSDILSPTKLNVAKQSSIFSPRKASNRQTPTKSILKPSFMSPRKTVAPASPKASVLFSPKKTKALLMSLTSTVASSLPISETQLKSCLKSPQKRQKPLDDSAEKKLPLKRHKTVLTKAFPSSVLLSPKIKQRTFKANCPPQDFCEDTMFMDTNEFIRNSGKKTVTNLDYTVNSNRSPILSLLGDNSQSSFDSIQTDREKSASKRKLSIQRKLFDNSPSNISRDNILPKNRRNSTIAAPNFFNIEPETDESNGFKC